MPRKKKTYNAQVYTLMEKQIVNTPVTKDSGRWISYGLRNNYPNKILDLYASSPTLDACISFAVSALIGKGLKLDGIDMYPNSRYDWNEMVRRLAMDYFLYGSFAFQVIKNRGGDTYTFYHQPIDTVRCSPRDENGNINSYWLSHDWTATGKYPPVEIKAFNMLEDERIKFGEPYLYVYESYSPMTTYYWVPVWSSAMKAVQAECEYLNYDLSNATNSFIPSGILSLPPSADDAERKAVVEEVKRTFVGTSNSSRLMLYSGLIRKTSPWSSRSSIWTTPPTTSPTATRGQYRGYLRASTYQAGCSSDTQNRMLVSARKEPFWRLPTTCTTSSLDGTTAPPFWEQSTICSP